MQNMLRSLPVFLGRCVWSSPALHQPAGSYLRWCGCGGNRILPSSCLDKGGPLLPAQHSDWAPHLCGCLHFLCVDCSGSCLEFDNGKDQDLLHPIARDCGLSTAFLVVSAGVVSKVCGRWQSIPSFPPAWCVPFRLQKARM